jgi:hypothetical protein
LDGLLSQIGCSSFGRIEPKLLEEDNYSILSANDDDDDDETDDVNQVLMEEFHKLISKHIKLQKRHGDLLCSHKKLIDSYALLEPTHEVMLTMVKSPQSHTCICIPHSIDLSCANSCYSQAKLSCD